MGLERSGRAIQARLLGNHEVVGGLRGLRGHNTGTVTGEVTSGQKLGNVVITFTGCRSNGTKGNGCPVNTEGAKAGEVISQTVVR
jgi:hypothetical protein